MLIRLRRCAGWSVPFLFAYGKNGFSQDVAHFVQKFLYKMQTVKTLIRLPHSGASEDSPILGHLRWINTVCFWSKYRMLSMNVFTGLSNIIHLKTVPSVEIYTFAKLMMVCRLIITFEKHSTHLSQSMTKPTKWPLPPAKTLISMGIHPVWSVFTVH